MRSINKRLSEIAIPARIARLPLSPEGWPTPWFVAWFEGVPDFRVIDSAKIGFAVRNKRCWICGDVLGRNLAFVIGPMCAINRVISEPPSHRECAIFAATACPFLSQPRMRRDEKNLPEDYSSAAGLEIKRNPGVACVWVTHSYRIFRPQVGAPGVLFSLGDPKEVLWFAHGRTATREEVLASIDSGFPTLVELAQEQGAHAVQALEQHRQHVMPLIPVMESQQ